MNASADPCVDFYECLPPRRHIHTHPQTHAMTRAQTHALPRARTRHFEGRAPWALGAGTRAAGLHATIAYQSAPPTRCNRCMLPVIRGMLWYAPFMVAIIAVRLQCVVGCCRGTCCWLHGVLRAKLQHPVAILHGNKHRNTQRRNGPQCNASLQHPSLCGQTNIRRCTTPIRAHPKDSPCRYAASLQRADLLEAKVQAAPLPVRVGLFCVRVCVSVHGRSLRAPSVR